MIDYNKLLKTAIYASYFAGNEIIKVRDRIDIGKKVKIDKSLVTDADINANNAIMMYLKSTDITIISEENIPDLRLENNRERRSKNLIWLVDPLDGTSEFVNGGEEFTVNIALIEDCKVVLGVVYVPMTKELYFANKEIGSFKYVGEYDENIIDNSTKLPYTKTDKYTIVASKLNLDSKTEFFIKNISRGKDVNYVNRSSSLKFCMVAEGTADIYPRFTCIKEWDTAAAHAIVKFAGKNVYTLANEELKYNKQSLMNTPFITK